MKVFTRGAGGLAAVIATAVVVSLMPGAEAAPRSAVPSTRADSAVHQTTAAADAPGKLTSRVRGTFHKTGVVRGTFVPKRFEVRKGTPYAVGTLHAVLRRGDGSLLGRTTRTVALPVKRGSVSKAATGQATAAQANCQVLDLVLGPLDLNLLGLKVHLNKVVLNIVASSGAGALLGNLLCAVAGLLDGTGLVNALKLSNVLNRILDVLRL